MNCNQYRAGIEESDFAAGRPAARSASHAEGCAECRGFRDDTAALRGLVGGLARVDAPPDFEFRLRARMSAADPARPRSWSQNLLPRAAWLAAAAGCLALVAALALQTRNSHAPDGRESSAQTTAGRPLANPVPTAGAETASRVRSGGNAVEVSGVESTAAAVETNGAVEAASNDTVATRRGVRAAPVAAANAAKLSQRRLAAADARPGAAVSAPDGVQIERTETSTSSMIGSAVIVSSAIPLPVSADERPLQVLFKDTQGAARVVNVAPVAFGSNDPAAPRPVNVTFTKAAKKQQGVW